MSYQVARVLKSLSENKAMCARLKVESEEIADLIPSTVQDIHHFADLVYAIKNPLFNIPHCMTYGRYIYLINELIRTTGEANLIFLDPNHKATVHQRMKSIVDVESDISALLKGLLVVGVRSSTSDLLSAPIIGQTMASYDESSLIVPTAKGETIDICLRSYRIDSYDTAETKEKFLRLKASDSPSLPIRSMFMITDFCFPITCVPGILKTAMLVDVSRSSDVLCYQF